MTLRLTKLEAAALCEILRDILDGDGSSVVMRAAKRISEKMRTAKDMRP